MTTIRTFLPIALLFSGVLLFAACNAEPEQPEAVEDAIEATEGPIEEEMQQEFGFYDTWDADSDAQLTYVEFDEGYGTESWWSEWDADGDTYLSEDEFNTVYSDYAWYTPSLYAGYDTDADGLLTEDELTVGLFDTWDLDDDAYLTAEEYEMNDGLFETM